MDELGPLTALVKKHEGFRGFPYKDTVGKLTIGYGRNLDDRGISETEAAILLRNDIIYHSYIPSKYIKNFASFSLVRRIALMDMAFNLGETRFSQFKNMIAELNAGNYSKASVEMLNSLWASQVGQRAKELARMMETDKFD